MELDPYPDDKDKIKLKVSPSPGVAISPGQSQVTVGLSPRRQVSQVTQVPEVTQVKSGGQFKQVPVDQLSPVKGGLKRYDGYDQGLNNSNVYKSGGIMQR